DVVLVVVVCEEQTKTAASAAASRWRMVSRRLARAVGLRHPGQPWSFPPAASYVAVAAVRQPASSNDFPLKLASADFVLHLAIAPQSFATLLATPSAHLLPSLLAGTQPPSSPAASICVPEVVSQ